MITENKVDLISHNENFKLKTRITNQKTSRVSVEI